MARQPRSRSTGSPPELPIPPELLEAPELPDAPELADAPELPDVPGQRQAAVTPRLLAPAPLQSPSGDDILALARAHVGEPYVLGARAPMGNAGWRGPWECAEFVSWCVYQGGGVLFGTRPADDPVRADAYTGYWDEQSRAAQCTLPVQQAAGIPGAVVLRRPLPGAIGHIVLSDGKGGTLEAHSRRLGVIAGSLSARRWDVGILVPGIRYFQAERTVALQPAEPTLRLGRPLMRGPGVRRVQAWLTAKGYHPGAVDGVYGPQTAHAVRQFQADQGLVADGEVGRATLEAMPGLA